MIMMLRGCHFIARSAAERVTLEDTHVLEHADGAIDGCQRDTAVAAGCPTMKLLDIGMVGGLGNDTRNGAALTCHAQALLDTGFLDLVHGSGIRSDAMVR